VSDPEDRDGGQADRGRVRILEGPLAPEHGPLAGAAGGPRYFLRPSVEWFVDGSGALCFVRPGDPDLVVRDPDPSDVALMEVLAAARLTADGLAHALERGGTAIGRDALRAKLDSLVCAGLVIERRAESAAPLTAEDAERFSRQLPYLAELGDETRLQHRLRSARIAVIGCGGIGSWAVAAVACLGVGGLVVVDDDVVELSNLNRQFLYGAGDVGTRKVTALARWVQAFDPSVDVAALPRRMTSEADVAEAIAGVDAVVLAADSPPFEIGRWVNAACLASTVPFVVAGQIPPLLKVGPTYIPGKSACFACHEAALRRDSRAFDDYVASRPSSEGVASTLGPASCVVGGLLGLEILHLLTGRVPATSRGAFLVDIRTLETRHEPVGRDRGCPACKHLDW
jgi:bacteriocin biosynthesis cyclodehydratase domain-containing protein